MCKKWIVKPNDYVFTTLDWNDIIYDGHGYVILSDGTRIDFADNEYNDFHKKERDEFNKANK